jgi:DNA-binding MarR family transcriptional regulator
MPVSVEQLRKEGTEVTHTGIGKTAQVIEILKQTDKNGQRQGYTQGEIAELLSIRPQYARSILMGLVEKKRVERRQFQDGNRTKIFYFWKK